MRFFRSVDVKDSNRRSIERTRLNSARLGAQAAELEAQDAVDDAKDQNEARVWRGVAARARARRRRFADLMSRPRPAKPR